MLNFLMLKIMVFEVSSRLLKVNIYNLPDANALKTFFKPLRTFLSLGY
jgi:hypothetical protein